MPKKRYNAKEIIHKLRRLFRNPVIEYCTRSLLSCCHAVAIILTSARCNIPFTGCSPTRVTCPSLSYQFLC